VEGYGAPPGMDRGLGTAGSLGREVGEGNRGRDMMYEIKALNEPEFAGFKHE